MKTVLNNILYVEDDPRIQTITRLTLEKIGGFNVKVCSSGKEALNAISEFKPELLLLDVMMPDMDGPTTLLALRRIQGYENIPGIFITAKAQYQEIDSYKEYNILDVISKPFDPMTLSASIRAIWEKNNG